METRKNLSDNIIPIPLWQSILFFGIPGMILYLGLYHGVPIFSQMGYSPAVLFGFFLWLPAIPLLPLCYYLFKREQKNNPGIRFKRRFRLNRLTGKDWLWVILGILITFTCEEIFLASASDWLASFPFMAPPEHFPAILNPLAEKTFPATQFLGVSLKGNWLFISVIVIFYPLAQIAEEFMWRGYILPRQEKTYGNKAWLINGLLWAYLFHFILKWNFISFLPSMLITPFIAQKTRNTWVALLIHGVPNVIILFLFFFLGVLGEG